MIFAKISKKKSIVIKENTVLELKRFPEGYAVIVKLLNSKEVINIGDVFDSKVAEEKFNAILKALAQAKEGEVVDLTIYKD